MNVALETWVFREENLLGVMDNGMDIPFGRD